MLCGLFLNLDGGGVSVSKIAKRPVSRVRGVQCSLESLPTSGIAQLRLVSDTFVAHVEKIRLVRCCL